MGSRGRRSRSGRSSRSVRPAKGDRPTRRCPRSPATRRGFPSGDPASRRASPRSAREDAAWLDDWAHFAALKESHGGLPWFAWDEPIRRRDPAALAASAAALSEAIARHVRRSIVSRRAGRGCGSGRAMRDHDPGRRPDLPGAGFRRRLGAPGAVPSRRRRRAHEGRAACPPDYFSETGQLWGNPLYRWDRLQRDRITPGGSSA